MTLLSDIQGAARKGLSARVTKQATIAAIVDNSGGAAADGTIGAVTDVATAAAAVKELATKQNEIIASLKSAGIVS